MFTCSTCGAIDLYWWHDFLYGWQICNHNGEKHICEGAIMEELIKCPACKGEGYFDNNTQSRHEIDCFECPICGGTGEITSAESENIGCDFSIEDYILNQEIARCEHLSDCLQDR